jgi:ribosomal protein S18 acetylase RimI-like enzyme
MIIRPAVDECDFASINLLNSLYITPVEPEVSIMAVLHRAGTRAWLAVDGDFIVGALVGKMKFDIPYVHSVSVQKDHRGRGIATELFNTFEEGFKTEATNVGYWLQVKFNNPAQKLYFDLGYRVESVDENFYGPGVHALCMYKRT